MPTLKVLIDDVVAFTRDLGSPVVDPPIVVPHPVVSGGLARPKDQAELQALLQGVADNGGGISFDGSTPPISVAGTITVNLKDVGDGGVVINGNGLRLSSTNTDGATPVLRFVGNTRQFNIEKFNIFGNGYATPGCGNGFEFVSSGGAIWLANFRDLVSTWCGGAAFRFEGNVFEASAFNLVAKDCKGSGAELSNKGGIISNFMWYGANLSRNGGFGMDLQDGCNSVDMFGGSFVLNGLGGINAPNGFRLIVGPNGENTGQALITMPFSAYPSTVIAANISSNGRALNSAQPLAKPSQYVLSALPANLTQQFCYVTPYTENTEPAPLNMLVTP